MPETQQQKPEGKHSRPVQKEKKEAPKKPEGIQWVSDGKQNEFLLKLFEVPGISAKKKQILAEMLVKHGLKDLSKMAAEVEKMAGFSEGCRKAMAEVFKKA